MVDRERKGGIRRRARRTQSERREETRRKLIEGMISALLEVGYARATTSEIARCAGITTGALQHHFETKDELLVAVVEHQFEAVREELEGFLQEFRSGNGSWRDFLRLLNSIYAGRRYLAVWEVLLGTRSDSHLNKILMQHRIGSFAVLERIWFEVFAEEPDKPDQALSDLMHFTLAEMRGRIFYDVLARDAQFNERQQALLEEVIEAQIAQLKSSERSLDTREPGLDRPRQN